MHNREDKIRKRFEAFWHGELVDRCMVSVYVTNKDYAPEPVPSNETDCLNYWTDGELIHKRILNSYEHTRLYGDALPIEYINLGAAGHAAYFKGCKTRYGEHTIWFDPSMKDYTEQSLIFDEQSFLYQRALYLAEYLTREANGRYYVAPTDNSGNADVLSHLRGADKLLMDFVMCPDSVDTALKKIQEVWKKTTKSIYNVLDNQPGGAGMIGWLKTWAPGSHGQLQCDLACMISPDMFDRFIMPELKQQCDFYDYPLYHLDGMEQINHLDSLLSLERLNTIQWTSVAGQPPASHFLPELKRIQSAGKNLVFRLYGSDDFLPLIENLSSKGLYIAINVSSDDEAEAIVKATEKYTHE